MCPSLYHALVYRSMIVLANQAATPHAPALHEQMFGGYFTCSNPGFNL
jgi:hypothetical protein